MAIRSFTSVDLGISDEQAKRILDKLDEKEANVHESKRRSPRQHLRGLAVIVIASQSNTAEVAHRVRLRDISQHGAAFLSRAAMRVGISLRIQLPVGPDGSIVEKRAVVRRCRYVEDMIHEIGAEFGS